VIPSSNLTATPAFVNLVTDTTGGYIAVQTISEAANFTLSGSTVTGYTPALIMYKANDASGNEHIYGLNLADSGAAPTPTQLSSLSVPINPSSSGLSQASNICDFSSAQTNITIPTTLFAVIHVAGSTGCGGSGVGDKYYAVHYTDADSTAPTLLTITTTSFNALYAPSGALGGLVLLDPVSSNLYFYASDSFTSPTTLLSGVSGVDSIYDEGLLNAKFSGSEFVSVGKTAGGEALYQISYTGTATKWYTAVGSLVGGVTDGTNIYFADDASLSSQLIFSEPVAGATPTKILTSSVSYDLVGSNGSLLVLSSSTVSGSSISSSLSTVPVTGASSVTALAGPFTGSIDAFLASTATATPANDLVFVTVTDITGSGPTISYGTEVLTPGGTVKQSLVANSTFGGLINPFGGDVFQIKGITDTDGGYGGGTVFDVNVGTLATAAFTTTGGVDYKVPAGNETLFIAESANIGVGIITNAPSASGSATTNGAAYNSSSNVLYPVTTPGANISPF